MKPVLIFRHIECEGPGYFGQVLKRRGIPFRIIAVDRGEIIPANLEDASALVFMGGSMSVNDPLPWIEQELNLIRAAQTIRMPVLGHCLGGQLIAKAMGARITPNRVKEIGWHPVNVENNAAAKEWCEGLPPSFDVFHWHGETFDLPAGAAPLLRSEWCANQAFATGNMLALQCHVEMTADMVREWTGVHCADLRETSASVQSAEEMRRDVEARAARLQRIADALYARWLMPLRGAD